MTRVFGYARDAESGAPLVGCEVTASLYPRGATVPGSATSGVDRYVTGADGRWELSLIPTAGTGVTMRIREWQNRTFYIDVPEPAAGDPPINVSELLVDPDTGEPPDPGSSLYLTRAEVGEPGGVVPLDENGKVPSEFLPPGQGGDENPVVDFFHGSGPPSGSITGAGLGDFYVDDATGLLYQLL